MNVLLKEEKIDPLVCVFVFPKNSMKWFCVLFVALLCFEIEYSFAEKTGQQN
jgi:hypothetical protein